MERKSQGRARETLNKWLGADRQTMESTSRALRERDSTQKMTSDPARSSKYERFNSRENQRERPSRSPQSVKKSPRNSESPSYRKEAVTPQVQSPRTRSYGEAARSRSIDRSNSMRSAQPQMSRPTIPQRNISQPAMSSPLPSRGGDRSFSSRSGGGSSAGNRSMRAVARSRANRR